MLSAMVDSQILFSLWNACETLVFQALINCQGKISYN